MAMTRGQIKNFYSMSSQLKALSMQLTSMGTQKSVMEALQSSSKIMGKVNEDMNIQEIQSMVKTFQKEQMKGEINSEMVNDAMDMGEGNEEADEVYD